MPHRDIPAFLSIHVEPDGYQLGPHGPAVWDGYDECDDLIGELRTALTQRVGVAPRFTWAFRMDPQVAATNPRADHAVSAFSERVDRLARHGDRFGIHVHPLRWSEERGLWFHDFVAAEWARHCIESSVEMFTRALGSPPRVHFYGAAYLGNNEVACLEALGVRVDLTPDRHYHMKEHRLSPPDASSGIDTAPSVGVRPGCNRLPMTAYRPSRSDARRADDRDGRQIVLVPLTACRLGHERPAWRQLASRLKWGLGPLPSLTMYPARKWPSPQEYWDLVEGAVDSMRRPYMSIALRSNAPGQFAARNARALLEHLPSHPLAKRLRFVDPVEAASSLIAPRARAGLPWARGLSAVEATPGDHSSEPR